ncbi:MAG: helix-turn-helix domain-containing protein [Candidatus Nanopelagicales bacterium]
MSQYDQGASIRSLAAETGRSNGFNHRLLTASETTLRGRCAAR